MHHVILVPQCTATQIFPELVGGGGVDKTLHDAQVGNVCQIFGGLECTHIDPWAPNMPPFVEEHRAPSTAVD